MNMSYCRFENTKKDLEDCLEHINDSDLSKREKSSRETLLELCQEIIDEWDYDIAHSNDND